jgi:phosphoribosylformylglycinamidine synthase
VAEAAAMVNGKVKVLVLRGPGTNCDGETVFAFERAGAEVTTAHINRLIAKEYDLFDFQVFVIPGGFTYGDDIAAGKVLANELKVKLGEEVTRFVDDGRLILGICNGFQVLMKAGILPMLKRGTTPPLTLTNNDSGKFECRWVYLGVNRKSPCVFTKGMDRMYIPVAHGEGKVMGDLTAVTDTNIAVYYMDDKGNRNAKYPWNPNGSLKNIAGICDDSGRVFALMPHPERHILATQHPQWTRLGAKKHDDCFPVFQNAVKYAKGI